MRLARLLTDAGRDPAFAATSSIEQWRVLFLALEKNFAENFFTTAE